MIQIQIRRQAWPRLLLAGALLVGVGAPVATFGADAETSPQPEAPAAEASLVPTAESTPFPTFDPSTASIRIDLFLDGLDEPVYITDDGTGNPCLYVIERGGTVRIVNAISGLINPKPFIDISKLVRVGAEQGLQAIAFHPDFKNNGRFFAHYNGIKNGASVIAEFKGQSCKPARSKAIKPNRLTVTQELPNNNGGWIGFGPDGYLYVALGDGGGVSPGDPYGIGQAKSSPLAKILRLDVDRGRGTVPPKDNPYAKKKQGFHPLTWVWGLHDPRRASFDFETGDLWIGDIGQDRFEEVNRVPAGSIKKGGPTFNFGWSDMEGDQCHNRPDCDPSLYEPPLYFYGQGGTPHGGITGGYVYRGEAIPALEGVYLFSDAISGFIWGIDAEAVAAGEPAVAHALLDAPQGIVSFGEDDDGELYVIAVDGAIYRIEREEA